MRRKIMIRLWTAATLLFLFVSCTTPLKEITYLTNLQQQDTSVATQPIAPYHIRPNDNLYINVISDNPEAAAFLNLSQPDRNYSSEASLELITHVVDDSGHIFLPYIGKIMVAGKTIDGLQNELQLKVNSMLANASVLIKLVNRPVTVLGDVNRPGQYTMRKNSMTIFEALGTAGDLNDYGNRQKVQLIRKNDNKEQIVTLDLTDSQLITSPYFYIQPNDVIYVPPKRRVYGAKTLPFTTVFTAVSTAVLLYTVFSK